MFKSAAEMFREAKNYSWTMVQNDWFPHNHLIGKERKVVATKSRELGFEGLTDRPSWCTFKASHTKFEGDLVIVCMSDDKVANFNEKLVYKLAKLS